MTNHFEKLKKILPESKRSSIFPCIEELVSKKPFLNRPSGGENEPFRQDITQFIAAWLKHVGLSADECRQWLIDFCTDVLSMISSSSKSKIRHSTKSNIKYIYNSDVSFECSWEEFSCVKCKKIYPFYIQIFQEVTKKRAQERKAKLLSEASKEVIEKPPTIREQYREQFDRAVQFIQEKINKGISRKDVVLLLNENGYKTRVGRTWIYSTLLREMSMYNIKKPKKYMSGGSDSRILSVKERYKEQFDRAWGIVLEKLDQGVPGKNIVIYLNEQGYKTRTGRQWTCSILSSEQKRR